MQENHQSTSFLEKKSLFCQVKSSKKRKKKKPKLLNADPCSYETKFSSFLIFLKDFNWNNFSQTSYCLCYIFLQKFLHSVLRSSKFIIFELKTPFVKALWTIPQYVSCTYCIFTRRFKDSLSSFHCTFLKLNRKSKQCQTCFIYSSMISIIN